MKSPRFRGSASHQRLRRRGLDDARISRRAEPRRLADGGGIGSRVWPDTRAVNPHRLGNVIIPSLTEFDSTLGIDRDSGVSHGAAPTPIRGRRKREAIARLTASTDSESIISNMRKILAAAVLASTLGAQSAWAGYEEGLAAAIRGDYATALRELRLPAEQGDAPAQYALGVMYLEGRGVRQDNGEALRWFRKSALQGNGKAEYNLGIMYFHGLGVRRGYAEAARWFKSAAERADFPRNLKAMERCFNPSFFWAANLDFPMKSTLENASTQPNPASNGERLSLSSFPYNG